MPTIIDDRSVDESGHYLYLIDDIFSGPLDDQQVTQVARYLATPIGGYRPVPQARKFHASQAKYRFCLGGNRCLGPKTIIDSPDGNRAVSSIKGSHRVWAWDGTRRVIADASEPWIKGREPCYRIKLASGRSFDCSASHRVLTEVGYFDVRTLLSLFDLQPHCDSKIVSADFEKQAAQIESYESIGVQPIYDFEVPELNNYIAAGIVHHNSSKSHAVAQEVAMLALDRHPWRRMPKAVSAWYATQTFEMVGEILWPKLEVLFKGWDYTPSWISRIENIPRSVKVRREDGTVSRISFKAYEQGRETFQGADKDIIAFDEQFPEPVYIEAITRIGAERDLIFFCALTPIDPQPWLEKKLVTESPENTEVFEFPLDDNRISAGGFIEDAVIDGAIAEWPEEVVETRRSGKWGSYIGAIFQSFKRDIHMVRERDEHNYLLAGSDKQRWLQYATQAKGSIDWGGANPFVFLWGTRLPHLDDAWYIFDELYWDSRKKGQRRLEEHAQEILGRTKDRWHTTLGNVWADHDPTDAFEFAGYGIVSACANKDVLGSIDHLRTLLKVRQDTGRPRIFIAERCTMLLQQLATYHWKEASSTQDAKNEPVKKDDHAVDALRYLTFSERAYDVVESHYVPLNDPGNMRRF